MKDRRSPGKSPAELVAIIRAARQIGDRDLERAARDVLLREFGIRVVFSRSPRPAGNGGER